MVLLDALAVIDESPYSPHTIAHCDPHGNGIFRCMNHLAVPAHQAIVHIRPVLLIAFTFKRLISDWSSENNKQDGILRAQI